MEIIERVTKVFVASDGKEFLTPKECSEYENIVLKNLKRLKYFKSFTGPDLNEGRGYNNVVYFAVDNSDYCGFERALMWLVENKGRTIDYVQGCSAMRNYTMPDEIKIEDFKACKPSKIGDYSTGTQTVFISKESLDGFPEPEWIK